MRLGLCRPDCAGRAVESPSSDDRSAKSVVVHGCDGRSARSTVSVRGTEPGDALIPCGEERVRRWRKLISLIKKEGLQSIYR